MRVGVCVREIKACACVRFSCAFVLWLIFVVKSLLVGRALVKR